MSFFTSILKKINVKNLNKSLKHFPQKQALQSPKKGLFIDCGSNLGQGYTYFKDYFNPGLYDAVLIEPNPNCMQVVKKKFNTQNHIEFIEAAAWIDYEPLHFYGLVEDKRGNTSDGGSVINNHNAVFYESNQKESILVKSISFSDLIAEKAKTYNQIIVKMDIESAEYKVLEDIISKGTAKHIDYMYIEFHSQYFDKSEESHYINLEKKLIKQLKKMKVGVSLWH